MKRYLVSGLATVLFSPVAYAYAILLVTAVAAR